MAPGNVITDITNGLGAVTTISYKPLTDTSVYSRMNDSSNVDWGAGSVVYDLVVESPLACQLGCVFSTFDSSVVAYPGVSKCRCNDLCPGACGGSIRDSDKWAGSCATRFETTAIHGGFGRRTRDFAAARPVS